MEGVESQVTLTVGCGFVVKEEEEEQGRVSCSLESSDNSVSSHPSAKSLGLATSSTFEISPDVLFDISRNNE